MLDIYTNNYSTVAQNNLNTANSALSKSIERLSSGLRINHASDDASGLAISEKLRGQIRGLAKASMNAQDAISFLQTAEGGMEVIGDMIQRMRELSVQAGNGTYTSNDRKELQKEVDQLKQEINRVSASTEFNTKKLLTGDAAALWSTNDPDSIAAIVKGAPAEGNYRLEVEASGGSNYVYKTDIMNLGSPSKTIESYDYSVKSVEGGASNGSFSLIEGEVSKNHDILANRGSVSAIAAGNKVVDSYKANANSTISKLKITGMTTNSSYLVVEVLEDGDAADGSMNTNKLKITSIDAATGVKTDYSVTAQDIKSSDPAKNTYTQANGAKLDFSLVGKLYKGDKIIVGYQKEVAATTAGTTYSVGNGPKLTANATASPLSAVAVELNNKGELSYGTVSFNLSTATGVSKMTLESNVVTKSLYELDKTATVGVNADSNKSRVIGGNYQNGLVVDITTNAGARGIITDLNAKDTSLTTTVGGTPTGNTGSYVIEVLNDKSGLGSYAATDFKVTFVDAKTGAESNVAATYDGATSKLTVNGSEITFGGGNLAKGDKILYKASTATAAPAGGVMAAVDNLNVDVPAGNLSDINVYNVQLDSSGNVVKSKVELSLGDNSVGMVKFASPKAKLADLNTKMRDISLFTNADGRNILDNTQEITIFGNGKTATVTIEGKDTVEDYAKKMNTALIGLGMGTGNQEVDNNLFRYITEEEASSSGNNAVAGTFVFQAGLVGENSKISIIGDQNVLNALSIAEIQKGENSDLKVTVTDAHNGKKIGEDTVSDNVLRGVIKGVDVQIKNANLSASYDPSSGAISFSSSEASKFDLHVVDNRTSVQIGANEGQMFDVSIAEMNTKSLGIDDAFVLTMDESQKAITKFDQALENVNSARATIGAQINRLEYTNKNLAISRQNLMAAESRIRDLDVAEESAVFANKQILVNAATAMLAQANQLPQVAMQLIGR